jgi:hypothetical protein
LDIEKPQLQTVDYHPLRQHITAQLDRLDFLHPWLRQPSWLQETRLPSQSDLITATILPIYKLQLQAICQAKNERCFSRTSARKRPTKNTRACPERIEGAAGYKSGCCQSPSTIPSRWQTQACRRRMCCCWKPQEPWLTWTAPNNHITVLQTRSISGGRREIGLSHL